jgi:SulP family sulfate permease
MIKTLFSEMRPFQGCSLSLNVIKMEAYSALVGAFLVIPQAIIFSYLAGLPPEYGMYSAIFITFIAAMFGTSSMVARPNTAAAILIGAAVLPLAGRGSPLYIEYVLLLLTLMVGLIQLVIWLLRGGKYFQYFSPVVINAIGTGVGTLIVLSALDGVTGINTSSADYFYQKVLLLVYGWSELANNYILLIAGFTLITGWYSQKI